jgi:hypothetical protein
MRELGRKGGKSRRKGVAEQLPAGERESLRQYLRDGLDHATIKAAIERSLSGDNESARVACVKFLSDLELYRKEGDECPRCAAVKAAGPESRAKIDEMIARYVEHSVRAEMAGVDERKEQSSPASSLVRAAVRNGMKGHEKDLDAAVAAAVGRIIDSIANGLVVDNDVSSERAAEILAGLEEVGLLVSRGRVEEMAEERAQERLTALKQEHGLVGV